MRGATYYLADGNYPAYNFTTTGTTLITIQKANATDQGQNCSPSIGTGWNTSTMGSAQAIFQGSPTAWNSTCRTGGNYTVNGVTGTGETGSSYGIKFINTSSCSSSGGCGNFTLDFDNVVPNVTLTRVEIQGGGVGSGSDGTEHIIWMQGTGGLLDHLYVHDSGCDMMQSYGPGNFTVQYSYFYQNGNGGGSPHCQAMWGNGLSNVTWRFNSLHNIGGSAIFTFATGSCLYPCVNNDIYFYGNTIWVDVSPSSQYAGIGDGMLGCFNTDVVCTNVFWYNNTISGILPYNGQSANSGSYIQDARSTFTSENNLYYNNNGNSGTFGSAPKMDHNSYLGSGGADSACTTACVNSPSASNPFVNSSAGNFQLAADTSNVNNWVSLSAPYNVDPAGTTRTTDRGAFQFVAP